jgi:hypothetical protein
MKRVMATLALCGVSAFAGATWSQARAAASRVSTEDFTEIQRLLYDNHTGYDFAARDNGEMWANTFTDDAVLDNPPTHLVGRKQIQAYATDPLVKDPKWTLRHWTTTFHVTPTAEGAILSAFYIAVQNNGPNRELAMNGTGRYESLVVKTKDGWRIKHHVVISEGKLLTNPNPAALRPQG